VRWLPRFMRVDTDAGYRWWTVGFGREDSDMFGWLKLGPVAFVWGRLCPECPFQIELCFQSIGHVWRLW
jgi:hypothetical protein